MKKLEIGKGVQEDCLLSLCLFNFYAECIMQNAGMVNHKLESRLLGEMSVTSDMQMTPPLMAEREEELKSLLMKVKKRVKKLA